MCTDYGVNEVFKVPRLNCQVTRCEDAPYDAVGGDIYIRRSYYVSFYFMDPTFTLNQKRRPDI